jgi:hypothetical protein
MKSRPARKNNLENARACGRRYVTDAAENIPERQQVVYLLELFRNSIDEMSILVLVADNGKDGVIDKL